MRAILIDPFTRQIAEVHTPGQYDDIRALVFGDALTDGTLTTVNLGAASPTGPDVIAYCDDNGHVFPGNATFSAWWYDGGNYPLAGRWLLIGTDAEGESCDLPPIVGLDGFNFAPDLREPRPLVSHWLDSRSTGEFTGAGPIPGGYTMGRPVVR